MTGADTDQQISKKEKKLMLKVREATMSELGRWYSALETDFDERELFPLAAIRRAVRRGDQEFLLFEEEESGLTVGYALVCTRNVYGYVLLKYFGIFPWYREHGIGIQAMRLLNRRYAGRQGILAELTAFDDSEDEAYLKKLRRFFQRFGYIEVPAGYRLGGADVSLYVKRCCGTPEIAPVARRMVLDFYARCLRPTQWEQMITFFPQDDA